jgi:uncharacterized RDD family membrane protein YckC
MYCSNCGEGTESGQRFCVRCGSQLHSNAEQSGSRSSSPQKPTPALAQTPYARFELRAFACVIDWILLCPLWFAIGTMIRIGLTHVIGWAVIAGALFLAWLYHAGMESSKLQATIGKLLFRMKVTDLNGERMRIGRATNRFLMRCVFSLIWGFNFWVAPFSKRRQAGHDQVADTLVVGRRFSSIEVATALPLTVRPIRSTMLLVYTWLLVGFVLYFTVLGVTLGIEPLKRAIAAMRIPAHH